MPSKKKKYNARFPPARIKKMMQADEEVGKVAAVVPVMMSRTLEVFVESLLKKASQVTRSRNAKTLTPAHLKASINSESQFSFLRDMVSAVPDIQSSLEDESLSLALDPATSSSSVQTNNSTTVSKAAPRPRTGQRAATFARSSSNSGNGRGRPRKVGIIQGSVERSVSLCDEDEDVEDMDDSEDLEDGDVEEEGSSCDNSLPATATTTSGRISFSEPVRAVPSIPLARLSTHVIDDDYDAV